MDSNNKSDRTDKFGYTKDDLNGIKVIKKKKKPVKESYTSFAEFLYEREEKFVADIMRWITIKDERDRNQHILIKKKDGTILGGMGGTRNGEKLSDVFKDLENKREEIKKEKEEKTSQLLTKKDDNTEVLNKTQLKKYITSFKKEAIKGKEFHEKMSISSMNASEEELNALSNYTSSSYKFINKLLRDPSYYEEHPTYLSEESKKRYKKYIEGCTNALKKTRTTESVVAYRGIQKELMEKLSGLSEGDVITDDGFASTSTRKKIAQNFAQKYSGGYVMTVMIPKGSQAVSVKSISHYDYENEILINRKARFEVKGIDHENQELIVELLPHEE